MTLVFMSLDRFLLIADPLGRNLMSFGSSAKSVAAIWISGLILAVLPGELDEAQSPWTGAAVQLNIANFDWRFRLQSLCTGAPARASTAPTACASRCTSTIHSWWAGSTPPLSSCASTAAGKWRWQVERPQRSRAPR